MKRWSAGTPGIPYKRARPCWAGQVARFYRGGPDLSNFDGPVEDRLDASRPGADPSTSRSSGSWDQTSEAAPRAPRGSGLATARRLLDAAMTGAHPRRKTWACELSRPAGLGGAGGMADALKRRSGRRLLYLHGGSFVMGSPRATGVDRFAFRQAGVSVLAIDYRLMPECSRRCRHRRSPRGVSLDSVQWARRRGGGKQPVRRGDSAGGNSDADALHRLGARRGPPPGGCRAGHFAGDRHDSPIPPGRRSGRIASPPTSRRAPPAAAARGPPATRAPIPAAAALTAARRATTTTLPAAGPRATSRRPTSTGSAAASTTR